MNPNQSSNASPNTSQGSGQNNSSIFDFSYPTSPATSTPVSAPQTTPPMQTVGASQATPPFSAQPFNMNIPPAKPYVPPTSMPAQQAPVTPPIAQQTVVSSPTPSSMPTPVSMPTPAVTPFASAAPTSPAPVQAQTQPIPVSSQPPVAPIAQQTVVSSPTPSSMPTTNMQSANLESKEDDMGSLDALAKKLADLKAQFIETVPEEPASAPVEKVAQPTVAPVSTPVMPQSQTTSQPIPPIQVTPVSVQQAAPTSPAFNPSTAKQEPVANNQTVSTPMNSAPVPMTASTVTEQQPAQMNPNKRRRRRNRNRSANSAQQNSQPIAGINDIKTAVANINAPVVPVNSVAPQQQPITQPKPNASTTTSGYSIYQLLDLVIARDASDLHITAGYPAMIRVDGELIPVSDERVTPEVAYKLMMEILPDQKKELLEVNREVDLAYSHSGKARFRINSYYQQQSISGAFRLIPNKIRSLSELDLPPVYQQLVKLGQGLVLVTGPTGSGKSTTLAGILNEINMTRSAHIITIEDPIEYILPKGKAMVDQREMHDDTHSWEIALKSALRQDPDVILVGEMRDYETIASAITLAETGHLVFATLHTNSAAQSIDRMIDVFPEHQQSQVRSQLSNIIEAVIAQRLIPIKGGGRKAVSEIMIANPAIRNLIREAKTHQIDNVIRTSADMGMISLENSLVQLVRNGAITMDLAQQYAVHPEEIVRLLK